MTKPSNYVCSWVTPELHPLRTFYVNPPMSILVSHFVNMVIKRKCPGCGGSSARRRSFNRQRRQIARIGRNIVHLPCPAPCHCDQQR